MAGRGLWAGLVNVRSDQWMAEGYPVKREDLAALSPYQTRHIKRCGDYVFTVTAPEPFDGDLITPFPLEGGSEQHTASA